MIFEVSNSHKSPLYSCRAWLEIAWKKCQRTVNPIWLLSFTQRSSNSVQNFRCLELCLMALFFYFVNSRSQPNRQGARNEEEAFFSITFVDHYEFEYLIYHRFHLHTVAYLSQAITSTKSFLDGICDITCKVWFYQFPILFGVRHIL